MGIKKIVITVSNNLVTDYRVTKFTRYLTAKGYDVVVVGRKWPGGDIPDGRPGKIVRLRLLFNKGALFYLHLNLRLFFFIMRQRWSKIVAVDLDTLPAAVLAGKFKAIPVIFDSHEFFTEVPELQKRPVIKKAWLAIQRFFIAHIKKGITVSGGVAALYKKKYNLDFAVVRNIPEKAGEVRDIVLETKNPVIYYQGALNIGRGLEQTIRALSFLPEYRLRIVGSGDIEDKLKDFAQRFGVDDRVEFVGRVPFEKLPHYAEGASVGICFLDNLGLNYFHSLPNRIFDYPRLGLPVIATGFPDISDLVSEYETGLLIDSLDPEIIAVAVRKACETIELREEWSKKLVTAAEELTWENEVKELDKLFVS
ncbi:glycosyltransferase [Marinilabiliaceae bacterium ANBcel2]|nr:glycosyltransferase [Marinilabiliaceae bacterium ANBcel2]